MKAKDIDKLDLVEAKRLLKKIFSNPLLDIYISTKKQVDDITAQIEAVKIVFGDDEDDKFDDFLKWADKLPKFIDTIYELEKKIDPTELARAKKSRLAPSELKPEFYAKRRKEEQQNK